MPFTYHSHSGEFCLHASGKLEEVVLEAINKNFKILGLSEHSPRLSIQDFYPEEKHLEETDLVSSFEKYIACARDLQKRYTNQIKILVGMETEWIHDSFTIQQLDYFKKYDLQYIIGSIHHEMVISFKPNIIGHFDLIRIFSPQHKFSEKVLSIISKTIDLCVEQNALFEINSRAYKKNLEFPYPHPEIIKIIQAKGGKFTISDDSHGPSDLGLYYSKLIPFLHESGIDKIYYIDYDSESGKIITKEYENFFTDSFWKN
ncbi:hypothetical protein BB560_004128 [Smittium megazygosporum]|uniref:Histidinol-phosphatase n=1 Tax=Smittium megazygosporum TaxID=133381 RepID=A0A2T9ZA46_9FUNG|nr:hypothetical protein BB560_004128 [Smittium megazygosporum]